MPETVITSTGTVITVPIPGTDRVYDLRAPTWGEVGDLAARAASTAVPSDAIFVDALRAGLAASDLPGDEKAAHLAALDADEEAQDVLGGLYAAHGNDRTTWSDDTRREIASADTAASAARRRRMRAEWAMRDNADVIALRRFQLQQTRAEQVGLVALCRGVADAVVEAMPAGDVVILHAKALAMVRPSPVAEKN